MFIRFHLANDDSGVVGKSYDFGGRPSDTNPPGKLVMSCYLINISLLPSKLWRKGSNWISEWDAAGNSNYSSGSCTSGRTVVGLRKRTCPRSTEASRNGHQVPHLQTQIVSGAPFFGCRDPVFRCEGFKTKSSLPTPLARLLRYKSPSRKNRKSPWEPAHPAHSPRLQTQHALTTTTGAYAETTFPFRISAGAMTFKSPPLTMDTNKIEVRLYCCAGQPNTRA